MEKTDVFIRFRLTAEEYEDLVSAQADRMKVEKVSFSAHQFCRDLVVEAVSKD